MAKTEEKPVHSGPWQRVQGSISTDEDGLRAFRLGVQAYDGGPVWRQRVEVSVDRLARFPGLYRTLLDQMVVDIAKRVER